MVVRGRVISLVKFVLNQPDNVPDLKEIFAFIARILDDAIQDL